MVASRASIHCLHSEALSACNHGTSRRKMGWMQEQCHDRGKRDEMSSNTM